LSFLKVVIQISTILQFGICDCLVMYIETISNEEIMQQFQDMKTRRE